MENPLLFARYGEGGEFSLSRDEEDLPSFCILGARVAELADASDSKSEAFHEAWGFESPLWHHLYPSPSRAPFLQGVVFFHSSAKNINFGFDTGP